VAAGAGRGRSTALARIAGLVWQRLGVSTRSVECWCTGSGGASRPPRQLPGTQQARPHTPR
jgi:hypothetical protein